MSSEKITYDEQDLTAIAVPVKGKVKFNGRVDINHLMARARKEKTKENKINLVFFALIFALILVVGIILSF